LKETYKNSFIKNISFMKRVSVHSQGPNISTLPKILLTAGLVVSLYLASLYSYLLFHTLAEMFVIIIAGAVFGLAWSFRRFYGDSFLFYLGALSLFVAALDLVHTLAYKDMNIFAGYDANLPTQLWIAARFMQSIALLLAPFFINRWVRDELILAGFALVTVFLLLSIFTWKIFPDCFIEGTGLTQFKIISEYVIDLLLIGSMVHLYRYRRQVDRRLLPLFFASISATILAEVFFTFYIDVFGLSNLAGHILRIIAAYLLYKAVIEIEAGSIYTNMNNLVLAEAALRDSEMRFRHLADAMPQLGWMAGPDGTVDYYNERHVEYSGITRMGEAGWQWSPVLHPEDAQATMDAWNQAVTTGKIYEIEHRVRMKDNTFRWHLSRGFPVCDRQGLVMRWFGTATDIHDLKQAEVNLAGYAEKLQASNRSLEQFAFVASHDLQEPLRKIDAFSDSLRRHLGDQVTAETADYLERMQSASRRMRAMIDGLLELSRVNSRGRDFDEVDLTQVASEALANLEERVHASGGEVSIDPLPVIEADALQMRQLFQNIVGNALKFHRKDTPPRVSVSGAVNGADTPAVTITIADNGIGFEEQNAERIFQPFTRLHGRSEFEGTGMGLAIVQKIVERHHGRIEVHSMPGEGSVFRIILPLTQQG
jgi:PAS domain S-box-containing protein